MCPGKVLYASVSVHVYVWKSGSLFNVSSFCVISTISFLFFLFFSWLIWGKVSSGNACQIGHKKHKSI